jgi:hypothetical protein
VWRKVGVSEFLFIYMVSKGERSIFSEVVVSVILSTKVYMCMRPIPNGLRDRVILLYSFKIVNKEEILRTVSDTSIYCSSDKVGTVYLVQYIFENSTSTSIRFATRVRTWLVVCLSAAWLSLTQAMASIVWSSSSSRVSTCVHFTLHPTP